MACRSINLTSPLTKPIKICSSSCCFPAQAKVERRLNTSKLTISRTTTLVCSAVQESSSSTSTSTATATATATAEAKETKELKKAAAAAKPKPPAKAAAAKSLPQLMEQDVIPPLKATFDAQDDLSEIQVSFRDNRLEGSFMKSGTRYSFWAFFPDGNLTGPKGFSLSSYGSGVSTVEPFLIDEKKITGKHVVFWVEKRLAAQGILPVWKE